MDQDERLSEALAEFELGPTFGEHRRLPRSVAEGIQTIGSPFSLLTFFLATQKESELLPGTPRPTGAGTPNGSWKQKMDPGSGLPRT